VNGISNLLLQTQSLRLGHQEPHKKEHTKAKRAKDEIRPISILTHRLQHMRHRLRNHEVEEPLGTRCNGHIHRSQSRSRDFRHDDPTTRSPSKLKERCKEKDTGESEVSHGRDRGARLGRGEADVETDDEHSCALGDGCPEERTTTAERIGGEEEKGGAGDHLYNTVDAGCEEACLSSGDAEVLED
jgi:hypothetical protein